MAQIFARSPRFWSEVLCFGQIGASETQNLASETQFLALRTQEPKFWRFLYPDLWLQDPDPDLRDPNPALQEPDPDLQDPDPGR